MDLVVRAIFQRKMKSKDTCCKLFEEAAPITVSDKKNQK